MTEYWTRLTHYYDGLAVRERGLVLAACVVTLCGVWDLILFRPLEEAHRNLGTEYTSARDQLRGLDLASQDMLRPYDSDPNAALRREEEELERRISLLDNRLSQSVIPLIPPQEMARVLEGLLDGQSDLQLVRLESRSAQPLHMESSENVSDQTAKGSQLFQHGLLIELEGSYMSNLHYLERAEQLPWRFFWDRLDYRVTEYPRARLQLELHTVSSEEEWIGV